MSEVIMDYPAAWEYVKQFPYTSPLHDPKCSVGPTRGRAAGRSRFLV